MSKIAGWTAILLATISLAPSIVPGAMSIFGMLISLVALIISVFSVKKYGRTYFVGTLIIIVLGLLLVNDGLRVWDPVHMPIQFRFFLYGIFLCVLIICTVAANKLNRANISNKIP